MTFALLLLNCTFAGLMVSIRPQEMQARTWLNPYLITLIVVQAICLTPLIAAICRFSPDWSLMYLVNRYELPNLENWMGVISFGFLLLQHLMFFTGYTVARIGIHKGQPAITHFPTIFGLLGTTILAIFFGQRLFLLGSYEEFTSGAAQSIWKSHLGWLPVLSIAGMVIGSLITLRYNTRDADQPE
ncbi:MAG: hypothetical protein VYA34_06100 [Myxococcota bacterium]|nr:hypothetical protein [Myxococcota bacterium]